MKQKLESEFQASLISELKDIFNGCVVIKNDPTYIQGFPDLLVLYRDRWAAFECKRSLYSQHQPNQDYYVSYLNDMSFCRFICPENRKEVLDELQRTWEA